MNYKIAVKHASYGSLWDWTLWAGETPRDEHIIDSGKANSKDEARQAATRALRGRAGGRAGGRGYSLREGRDH